MLETSTANLIGGLIFGAIGFVAFVYGKRTQQWRVMFSGIALMIFPYFVENIWMLCGLGVAGTLALCFLRA